jgi:hypothetical protein
VIFRNLNLLRIYISFSLIIFLIYFVSKRSTTRQCNTTSSTSRLSSLLSIYDTKDDIHIKDEDDILIKDEDTLLVLSLNFKEEESWFKEWLIRTSFRLRYISFGLVISVASDNDVVALKKIAESVKGPQFVLFSTPFPKGKIGPFLLEGHRRNLELSLTHHASRRLTHVMLLASNCAFVRDISSTHGTHGTSHFSSFVIKNPAIYGLVSFPSTWHWAPAVLADGCLKEWRRRIDKAILCEQGSLCALGKSSDGLRVGEDGIFAGVSEGLVATRFALLKIMPLIDEYMHMQIESGTSSGRFRVTVGGYRGSFWGLHEGVGIDYPAEEVVFATALALLDTRKGLESSKKLHFSHTLRAFFEWGRAVEFTPTIEELKALMNNPEGLLLAKRVPRDPTHPLWLLAAGEEIER